MRTADQNRCYLTKSVITDTITNIFILLFNLSQISNCGLALYMNTWILICTIALAVALVSCGGGGGGNSTLTEQTPPPLTAQTPILGEEPSSSTNNVYTSLNRVKIVGTEPTESGIKHRHNGQGTITVIVNNSNIKTTGNVAHAIQGWHLGTTGVDNKRQHRCSKHRHHHDWRSVRRHPWPS